MEKEFIELDLGEDNPEAYEQALQSEGRTNRKNVFIKRERPKREEWEKENIQANSTKTLSGESLGETLPDEQEEEAFIKADGHDNGTDCNSPELEEEPDGLWEGVHSDEALPEPECVREKQTEESESDDLWEEAGIEASLPESESIEERSVVDEIDQQGDDLPEAESGENAVWEQNPNQTDHVADEWPADSLLEEDPAGMELSGPEDTGDGQQEKEETGSVLSMEKDLPHEMSPILEVDPVTGQTDVVYTDQEPFAGGSFVGDTKFQEEAMDLADEKAFSEPVPVVADPPAIAWYLKLPWITIVVLIPVIGWLAAGILLYQRYQRYGYDEQTRELTKAYVLCIVCLIVSGWIIAAVALRPGRSRPAASQEGVQTIAVTEPAERQAAESLAREEAEKKESEAEQAQLRSSAQANIGLEHATVKQPVPVPIAEGETALEGETESMPEDGSQPVQETRSEAGSAAESAKGQEGSSVIPKNGEEEKNVWRTVLDRLTGNDRELGEAFGANAEADREELEGSGDSIAWYSLQQLSSAASVLTARYDDRFQAERDAVFAFMSGYQGMEISNQTFNLRTNFFDMFQQTVHWEATLDQTPYRYLGTITDGLPQGMGVVLTISSANPNTYIPLYAGTFVNGSLEGYGMTFRDNGGYYGIVHEGYYVAGKYAGRGTSYVIPSYAGYQSRMQQVDSLGVQYSNEEISSVLAEYTMRYNTAMNLYQGEQQMYTYIDVPMLTPIVTERGRYDNGSQTGYFVQYGSFGQRVYAGVLRKGVRSGPGIAYFPNGQVQYDGEWRNGRYNGTGVLYQEDGNIRYSGEFLNGDIKPVSQ